MKKISIIIPFYFNEENIPFTLNKIYEVFKPLTKKYRIEFIFVDDGSLDYTWDLLSKSYNRDFDHKIIRLSKNFGSHNAILAGVSIFEGNAVGMITSDLQDPPELFLDMINEWESGNDIVMAVRNGRDDGSVQNFFSNIYYRLLRRFSSTNMPLGGFDFFLIDRKVSDVLAKTGEKNSSITCQIAWAGFKRKLIYYKRAKRKIGRSRWTFAKKIRLFIDSFVSFSVFPIRLIQVFGIFFSLAGFLYIIVIIYLKINGDIAIQGIATVIALLCLISGLILLSLSIIGEYIWRILDESRKRPSFIIEKYLKLGKKDKPNDISQE